MRNKILLPIVLLLMILGFSNCVMHYEGAGTNYAGRHRHGRYHYGTARHYNGRHAYWGKHRYGPRPHDYRGAYR